VPELGKSVPEPVDKAPPVPASPLLAIHVGIDPNALAAVAEQAVGTVFSGRPIPN
jgi:hypothetical protein